MLRLSARKARRAARRGRKSASKEKPGKGGSREFKQKTKDGTLTFLVSRDQNLTSGRTIFDRVSWQYRRRMSKLRSFEDFVRDSPYPTGRKQ